MPKILDLRNRPVELKDNVLMYKQGITAPRVDTLPRVSYASRWQGATDDAIAQMVRSYTNRFHPKLRGRWLMLVFDEKFSREEHCEGYAIYATYEIDRKDE